MSRPRRRLTMTESLMLKVADLTECPICRESMRDPRILHCVHTFCCECLLKYSKDHSAGHKIACPVCRSEFQIPHGGLKNLPKNFIVEKLCDAHNDDDHWADEDQPQKYGGYAGSGDQVDRIASKALNKCDKHHDELADGYCCDCQTPVCSKCESTKHQNHDCCSIENFYTDFKKDMHHDLGKLEKICGEVDGQGVLVYQRKNEFIESVEKIKLETRKRGDEIKMLIDKQVKLMHEEMEYRMNEYLKDCDVTSSLLQLQKTQLESFKLFTSEILQRADPGDLAYNAKDIKTRSTELLGTLVAGLKEGIEVSLEPLDADLLEDSTYNLIGQIEYKKHEIEIPSRTLNFEQVPALIGTIECGEEDKEAVGMVVVEGELFVVVANSSEIKVYDAVTFEYKSKFLVETLAYPSDLAATKGDLFVFDNRNLTVHKVEISTKYSVNWSIQLKNRFGGACSSYGMAHPDNILALGNTYPYTRSICGPGGCANGYQFASKSLAHDFSQVALSFSFYKSVSKGFSLTPKGTVLLISPSNFQREIIEFTGDGRVLREMTLSFFVHEPRHIAMLNNDKFLLCYGTSNYIGVTKDQLSLVDGEGRLVKRWSNQSEESKETCNMTHFALDANENVYLCDYVSGVIQLYDPSLRYVKNIIPKAAGLTNPSRVYLEKPRGRLFVSDSANKRLSVFQLF